MQGTSTFPHGWDARGNLTFDGERSFTWNDAEELVAASDAASRYAYDAAGWRVRAQEGTGDPVYFLYDRSQRLLARWDATTGTETDFLHAGGRMLVRIQADTPTYVLPDWQGSPLFETDANAGITRQPVYLGYGRTDAGGRSEIPGYTGATMDPATGQTYLGARYLHQKRFTSPDPAELNPLNPNGLNRYAYANNNPVRYTDPDGRCANCITAGVGAVVGPVVGLAAEGYPQYERGEFKGKALAIERGKGAVVGAVVGFAGGLASAPAASMSMSAQVATTSFVAGGVGAGAHEGVMNILNKATILLALDSFVRVACAIAIAYFLWNIYASIRRGYVLIYGSVAFPVERS